MNDNSKYELSRALKNRHIQMIAIGGAIGTGLFLGSGTAISEAGPSIIVSYLLTGIICFFLMRSIGELLLSDVSKHSFIEFIGKYLGNKWEFISGWTYCLCWLLLAMTDLTASGIYMKFWFPNLKQWITPLIIIIFLLLFNLVNVKFFGELESGFSLIKVLAILCLIVVGFYLILIHFHTNFSVVSLHNLVNHGGFFPTGMSGFLKSFQMVIFAFVGIEMVGLTAGETENPEVNLPKAVNSLPIRIGLFYIGSMIVIMSVYPWNKIVTDVSPFVQVFSTIGIKSAAAIINFVVLTAAISACNSAIFTVSRTIRNLAQNNHCPQILAKLNKRKVPINSLYLTAAILMIVVLLNFVIPKDVFNLLSGVSSLSFIFVWLILMLTHLVYKRQNKYQLTNFKMPLYPYSDYLSLAFFIISLVVLSLDTKLRLALILVIIWLIILYAIYSFKTKSDGS